MTVCPWQTRSRKGWLKPKQVLDVRGDWAAKQPEVRPGGWAFQYNNAYYPDLDDTAVGTRDRKLHLVGCTVWRQNDFLPLLGIGGYAYPQNQQEGGADGGKGDRSADSGTAKTILGQRTNGTGKAL